MTQLEATIDDLQSRFTPTELRRMFVSRDAGFQSKLSRLSWHSDPALVSAPANEQIWAGWELLMRIRLSADETEEAISNEELVEMMADWYPHKRVLSGFLAEEPMIMQYLVRLGDLMEPSLTTDDERILIALERFVGNHSILKQIWST